MDLTMDGRKVLPQPGQSLLELVKQLGLDGSALTKRPLAAKIAGEVFTLNYIPVRQKEAEADRQSMRRAMAASNGEIRLLRYADPAGKECYIRTAQFAIFLAMGQLWPEATAKMTCTLGSSVYISVAGARDFSASTLKARVNELVEQDIPLIRRRVKLQQAIDRFRQGKAPILADGRLFRRVRLRRFRRLLLRRDDALHRVSDGVGHSPGGRRLRVRLPG